MSKHNLLRKPLAAGALLSAGVALAAALSGCGGDKVNGNAFGTIPDTTPAAYGLDPLNYLGGNYGAASALVSASGKNAYATEATASNAQIASGISQKPLGGGAATIPLGFAPGGATITGAVASTAAPGASVVFRAALANGVANGANVLIDQNNVTLTSPEVSGFTQKLAFNNPNGGILPSATYATGAFTLPFTTTGIHPFRLTVGDVKGRTSFTDYGVVVLAGTDAGVLVQATDAKGNPLVGATVTITNPVSGGGGTTTTDAQGVAVLFAAPGTQTVSVTSADGATTYSAQETLTAGTLLTSTDGKTGLVLAPA